jgi:long-chain acyl-CoA synthetase
MSIDAREQIRPWLKHYDRGVPPTLQPYPQRTLLDEVDEAVAQRPDHPALLFKGARLSYGELDQLSNALSAELRELGISPGDRVALLLPNCPQFVISLFGIWKAGAVAVPSNPMYTEHELAHAMNESGARMAIVLTPFYAKLKTAQPHTRLERVIATNIKEYLPQPARLLFTLVREKKEGHRVELHEGDLWLSDLLRRHAGTPDLRPPVSASDPAVLLFTGGTTGLAKCAIGTHQGLLMAGLQIHSWFSGLLQDWDDVIMLNMPLFHAYALAGVLTTGLIGHNTLALVPNPRDLDDMVATIGKVRPAFLPGVPTLFIALLNHRTVLAGQVDLRSIKLCISGAAPLMAETKERFEALTGGRILEAYALTESMLAATLTPLHGAYKPGSVGMPLPDVEIRIVDADTGVGDLPAGKVGEILLRAPQVMTGYWGRPAETASTLREGWLHTGDLGYLDDDGYLFVVDRLKDLIKPSGFQVWPREVEEVLAQHPAVAEVGVAGVPDPVQSEAVKAWVVLRAGCTASVDELRAHCRSQLAAYKVPKHIEFRDSLPKSTIGKVLRRELSQPAER